MITNIDTDTDKSKDANTNKDTTKDLNTIHPTNIILTHRNLSQNFVDTSGYY